VFAHYAIKTNISAKKFQFLSIGLKDTERTRHCEIHTKWQMWPWSWPLEEGQICALHIISLRYRLDTKTANRRTDKRTDKRTDDQRHKIINQFFSGVWKWWLLYIICIYANNLMNMMIPLQNNKIKTIYCHQNTYSLT
jgi:hypothetical protein